MKEEELINKYELLIYKIAKKFYNVEISDLYQAGCIGLIKASRNYDEDKKGNFLDFAYKYIFGEMYDLANKSRDIKLNKEYLKLYKKIIEAKRVLMEKLNHEPSDYEVCLFLEMEEELYSEVITLSGKMMSIDDEYQTINGDNLPIKECIGKCDEVDNKIIVEDSIMSLDPIEQDVIKIRYFSDLSQMETASILGISQVKVSRIEQRGKQKIKKYIAA